MKLKRIFPWLITGLVSVTGVIQVIYTPQDFIAEDNYLVGVAAFVSAYLLLPVTFASLGALIVTRQPGNRVGWLMMVNAISGAAPVGGILEVFFPSPPTMLSPVLWMILWLQNWLWLLGFLSIFLIVLNFPDGRPPSRRWDWLNTLALGMLLFWAVSTMFWDDIEPTSGSWTVTNPIGFIPESAVFVIGGMNFIGLFILAGGSIASLFVRFRRAEPIERQQIKWLLFAGTLSIMAIGLYVINFVAGPPGSARALFLLISILAVPITIAIGVLRYRLYNIDIIIRRTLTYGILTGLLTLVYFSSVTLLQSIATSITGQNTPVVIVRSTLGIAALFNPLRIRIQDLINRRFYRRKYDAEKVLAVFSATMRDEIDLERLTAEILALIEETMQPEHMLLWLKSQS